MSLLERTAGECSEPVGATIEVFVEVGDTILDMIGEEGRVMEEQSPYSDTPDELIWREFCVWEETFEVILAAA